MSEQTIHVAIIIVAYNSRDDLGDCLESVLASDDAGLHRHVIVVDNASTDGTCAFLAQRFPQVDLIESRTNLGFAGGNNFGWTHIRKTYPNCRYLMLLNPDTIVQSGYLCRLVDFMQQHEHVASVQPKLMLYPQTDRFNSVGNRSHFLGFGFVTAFGERDEGQYDTPRSIDFASGAAVMVRTDLLNKVGLFDEEMFMYLEDADLSWKLRMLGYETYVVPESVVYHMHDPDKTLRSYEHLERNRLWLVFSYYKWRTVLLIGPALALMELGTLWFAWRNGYLRNKLRAYAYFLRLPNIRALLARRRNIQSHRTISDRQFTSRFTGRLDAPQLKSGWIKYVANPIFCAYWSVAKRLIFW